MARIRKPTHYAPALRIDSKRKNQIAFWLLELTAIQRHHHSQGCARLNLVGTDIRLQSRLRPDGVVAVYYALRASNGVDWIDKPKSVVLATLIAQDNGERLEGSKLDIMRSANGELLT